MILDDLNVVLEDHGVEGVLRIKMRSFLHSARQTVRRQSQVRVLDNLSPGLQGEYALSLHTYWITDTPWLEGTSREFVTAVFRFATLSAHAKGETLGHPLHMYYLRMGMIGYAGQALRRNQSWGYEQMVLSSPTLLQDSSALAMTFVEVYGLSREHLNSACFTYPSDALAVRRAAVRLAFRSAVHYIIRTKKTKRMLEVLRGSPHPTRSLRNVEEQLQQLCALVENQSRKLEAMEARGSALASPLVLDTPVFKQSTVLSV
jgi:hypothetical protein